MRTLANAKGAVHSSPNRFLVSVFLYALLCHGACTKETNSRTASHRGSRIETTLITTQGQMLFSQQWQGSRVLYFVFTTFDTLSHASVASLRELMHVQPSLKVVGIVFQPQAQQLAQMWVSSLNPPFVVGSLHNNAAHELGGIDAVPLYILVDKRGNEIKRRYGFLDADALIKFVD